MVVSDRLISFIIMETRRQIITMEYRWDCRWGPGRQEFHYGCKWSFQEAMPSWVRPNRIGERAQPLCVR